MDAAALERYLHEHIPLSAAMRVSVGEISDNSVVLCAPLLPNINHRETVFGGSASALAILAAWSLVHLRLQAGGAASRLVIQRNRMEYILPILGTFYAHSFLAEPDRWDLFLKTLRRKGMDRIPVGAKLMSGEREAGRFEGEFVALAPGLDERP